MHVFFFQKLDIKLNVYLIELKNRRFFLLQAATAFTNGERDYAAYLSEQVCVFLAVVF